MEGDGLCFDLAVLDINFVTAQNDRDVFAHSDKIAMPLRNVLVGHATGDVKHDYRGVTLDAAL